MNIFSLLALILFFSCSTSPRQRTDKLSIIQGITNTKEVEFNVLAPKNQSLRFELRDEKSEIISPDEVKVISRDFSEYAIHKMVFVRDKAKDYNFYAFEGDKIVDQRLIGRGQLSGAGLRLAVTSCMSDYYDEDFKIWDTLFSKAPEYLVMVGDNVYTDASSKMTKQVTNPEIIWNRYVETRLRLPVFFQQKLIPIHAIWDDHDLGENDGGKSFQHLKESQEIFLSFFAQDLSEDDYSKGHGVGGLLSLGDFNLYFLDGRSFRTKNPDGQHLGIDQTAWFYSKLREEATPSFIIKGDQFFGGYHKFESFEANHPESFAQYVTELKKINTPFVFVSGDRHMSEIMQFPRSLFGKPSFEITSSPLHARTFQEETRNPWRVVESQGVVNFTIINNEAKENHWFLEIENIGKDGESYFKRELAVYIKDLQNNLEEVRKRRSGKRRYRKVRTKKSRR